PWPDGRSDETLDERVGRLLDTLAGRLSWERLRHGELLESHWPERAARFGPFKPERRAPNAAGRLAPEVLGDRPTVLFERPEPLRVIAATPDGPVLRCRWRNVEHVVAACLGPQRIAPEWWRGSVIRPVSTRDYFK